MTFDFKQGHLTWEGSQLRTWDVTSHNIKWSDIDVKITKSCILAAAFHSKLLPCLVQGIHYTCNRAKEQKFSLIVTPSLRVIKLSLRVVIFGSQIFKSRRTVLKWTVDNGIFCVNGTLSTAPETSITYRLHLMNGTSKYMRNCNLQ